MVDIAIIGAGPAGLSAAVNARIRNKSVLLLSGGAEGHVYKAERVDNYLGLPACGGAELMRRYLEHAASFQVEPVPERVQSVLGLGDGFMLSYGVEVEEARSLILATGVAPPAGFPGEQELLGRGVSYCATCDGMLYRNRPVTVVGRSADSVREADFLREIGCQVTYVADRAVPEGLHEDIRTVIGRKLEILGDGAVTGLSVDGTELPCAGVFILRDTIAPQNLFPGLRVEKNAIVVNRRMETSEEGIYAAGDCTGGPYQIAKAVGEGLVAALSAAERLDRLKKAGA